MDKDFWGSPSHFLLTFDPHCCSTGGSGPLAKVTHHGPELTEVPKFCWADLKPAPPHLLTLPAPPTNPPSPAPLPSKQPVLLWGFLATPIMQEILFGVQRRNHHLHDLWVWSSVAPPPLTSIRRCAAEDKKKTWQPGLGQNLFSVAF